MTCQRCMTRTIKVTNASQGGKLGRVGNMLFSSDPCFSWTKSATWCSHGRRICKNRIMPLFDQGLLCAKTPPEYLASGRFFFVAGARRRCGALLNTPWSCSLAGLYLPSPEFWIEAIWEEKLLSQENKWDLAGLWVRNVPSCHLKPWPKWCERGSGRGHLL